MSMYSIVSTYKPRLLVPKSMQLYPLRYSSSKPIQQITNRRPKICYTLLFFPILLFQHLIWSLLRRVFSSFSYFSFIFLLFTRCFFFVVLNRNHIALLHNCTCFLVRFYMKTHHWNGIVSNSDLNSDSHLDLRMA